MELSHNIQLITDFLKRVHSEFNHSLLKLEARRNRDTFIVDVAPKEIYHNDIYIKLEESFKDNFEKINPNATLIFVTEGDLIRANDNNLTYILPELDLVKDEYRENKVKFKIAKIKNNYSDSGHNYKLAA